METTKSKAGLQDKIRGSLIGGAIGDALGYPIEFLSYSSIVNQYGEKGVTGFCEFDDSSKALFSDDTQMTLFTANGLLVGITRGCLRPIMGSFPGYVKMAYVNWYETQVGIDDYLKHHRYCWIREISELNARRAPGNTCMSALMNIINGKEVINDSKGCGGVMRIAPVPLFYASRNYERRRDKEVSCDDLMKCVAEDAAGCAAITHKHPLGYLSAAVLADIIFLILMYDNKASVPLLTKYINLSLFYTRSICKTDRELEEFRKLEDLLDDAMYLAHHTNITDIDAISRLGEGWTGDEALAIALFCVLRHIDDFNTALLASVNHDGDSDSTGAVCGNIMGALFGYEKILFPEMDKLELAELILEMSDDIYKGCHLYISQPLSEMTDDDKQWYVKYAMNDPRRPDDIFHSSHQYNIVSAALKHLQKYRSVVKIK